MEPLRPEERERILHDRPLAQPADIDEYETLLAERFTRDPSVMPAPAPQAPQASPATGPLGNVLEATAQSREHRLHELFDKLFGTP